jgi:HD-GYP domain-containing protein (c-di-GMP phosphodiesterase class II)
MAASAAHGGDDARGRSSGVRLSELVAVLSFASDFGLGQPMEHVLRSCLISLRLADRLGLDPFERRETYWVTLLATVCTGESFELAQMFGNEIAFRSGILHVGPSQLAQMVHLLGLAGSNQSTPGRVRAAAGMLASRGKTVEASFLAHCALTTEISRRFRLDPGIGDALSRTFARWDGRGIPRGISAEGVPRSVQLMQLADYVEVHGRLHGLDGALELARTHAGKQFAPEVAKLFQAEAPEILADLDEHVWDRVIEAEPTPGPPLEEGEFDAALEVMAHIADLKSPWFSGHSSGVAELAAGAVKAAGMPEQDITLARRAGFLHDLGRTGISNAVWDKQTPLTESERERVRLHTYYTERMLRRPAALAGLARIAAAHHERLDGSGHHRGIRGSDIPLLSRYLGAADMYHALLEDRPHRPARAPNEAASVLRAEVREGRLDAAAVDVLLGISGHRRTGTVGAPAGLTPREVEVLVLVARGASTRQVAQTLDITPKTAGNHIERIYTKIGASSRATATLFALEHGMLATLTPIRA